MGQIRRFLHQRFTSKGTFFRILIMYLTGIVITLFVYTTCLNIFLTRVVQDNVISHKRDMLHQSNNLFYTIMNDIYDSSYLMYHSYEAIHLMYASELHAEDYIMAKKLLETARENNSCIESIYIVNGKADTVISSHGLRYSVGEFYDQQSLELLANQPANPRHLNPRSARYVRDRVEYSLNLVSLCFNDYGLSPMGAVIVNIDQDQLLGALDFDEASMDDTFIINQDGVIISHTDSGLINTSISETDYYERITSGLDRDEFITNVNDKRSLIIFNKAPRLQFYFVSVVPFATISKSVAHIRGIMFAVTAGSVCIALLISMAFSKRIYRPLSDLVSQVRKLGSAKHGGGPGVADDYMYLGREYKNIQQQLVSELEQSTRLFRDKARGLLLTFLNGEGGSEEEYRQYLEKSGLPYHPGYFLCIHVIPDGPLPEPLKADGSLCWQSALREAASRVYSDSYTAVIFDSCADSASLLFNGPPLNQGDVCLPEMLKKELLAAGKDLCSFTIGVGRPVQSFVDIPASYHQAKTAASYRLVFGAGQLIDYGEVAARESHSHFYPIDQEKALLAALATRVPERIWECLDDFMGAISGSTVVNMNLSILQLYIALTRASSLHTPPHSQTQEGDSLPLSAALQQSGLLEEKKQLLRQFLQASLEEKEAIFLGRSNKVIDQALRYIELHYHNEKLGIEDIAGAVGLSSGYFRTLFKKVMGSSPLEYITSFRIEKAKELLQYTTLTTKEIAATAGYGNHRYFYRLFKEHVGMTATDFRAARGSAYGPGDNHAGTAAKINSVQQL